MMRYVIWHSPRTGSNLLCNLLHLTGVAGFRAYEHCGYFIGWPEHPVSAAAFTRQNALYFRRSRTKNGVESCKASFQYCDDLGNKVNWRTWHDWLMQFDYHIVMSRQDRVAQAVSMIFGGAHSALVSTSPNWPAARNKRIHDYSRAEINWKIAAMTQLECRFVSWLEWSGIDYLKLDYETLAADMEGTIRHVMGFLNIQDDYTFQPPQIEKQTDPRKTEWIERYRRGE